MFVAIARIALAIPDADSPKSKRQVVGKVIERVRSKFNASIAEVDNSGSWKRAVIGISVVGNEQTFVQTCIDKILAAVEELYVAPIVSRAIEIVPLGESLFGSDEWKRLESKLDTDLDEEVDDDEDGAGQDSREHSSRRPHETWPGVRTLADVEDPNDPEAAGFKAEPKPQKPKGGKAKPIKMMSDAEKSAALAALREQMKKPKDG
jgi:Uncharacterized protein conserved in bacteria